MLRKYLPLLLCLVVGGLAQAWFLGLGRAGQNLSDPTLSTAYVEALAAGQSYLKIQPDPRLLAAKDPFRSDATPFLLSDASLYHGRYYMYFGIVPFATLLVPCHLLTGHILSPAAAVLCFCLVGYAAYGSILCRTAEKMGRIRPVWLAAAVLVVMIGSGTLPLMGRPAIYEIENAAAYACLACSFLFLYPADGPLPRARLPLAAAFAALCMGCRPNYFPAVTVVACAIVIQVWRQAETRSIAARKIVLNLLPLAVIGLALAWWNYHRFDRPLDFGLKHTVSQDPAFVRPLAHPRHVPYYFHRYWLGEPRVAGYFPFIQGQVEGPLAPASPDQEPSNQVYGFLLLTPILAAALLGWRGALRPLRVPLLAAFAGNLVFLSSLCIASYRYPADFLGPLALLAGYGLLRIPSLPNRTARILATSAASLALAWSILAVICQVFSIAQIHSDFSGRRPRDFARVGDPFNTATYRLEQWRGTGPRGVALHLALPGDRIGQTEPLLVSGTHGAQDFVFIRYVHPGAIQLG